MYYEFYQLKENPFNVTADPDFFFSAKGHCQAISNLMYGIQERKGILTITGEVGTGKTTLCRTLLKQTDKKIKFAFILNPKFSESQLLQMIVQDLGIKSKEKNKFALVQTLNNYLLQAASENYNVVIIIDEAQNLTIDQLEQIRLLSNLETEKEKLLQLILIGQPELYEKLQLPALRQLRQRVAIHFHIEALEKSDVKYYINHRITIARLSASSIQQVIFTEKAFDLIFNYSKGSPRTINILCDRALLAGFVAETYLIDERIIENCAKEVLYCEHHL